MRIHTGKKYAISTDGTYAEKTDGATVRRMRFFPERDIRAIAGEIDELAAWRIFHDVAVSAHATSTPISPDHIFIDGGGFVLSEWSRSVDSRFVAPEGYSPVWALGATVFFSFLGCHVFQGLGGRGQSASTPVPTMRKGLPELSELVARCLDFTPCRRPSLDVIASSASENIVRCESAKIELPPEKISKTGAVSAGDTDMWWPERMC